MVEIEILIHVYYMDVTTENKGNQMNEETCSGARWNKDSQGDLYLRTLVGSRLIIKTAVSKAST